MTCTKCKNKIDTTKEYYSVEKDQCFVDDWRKEDEENGDYDPECADFGMTISINRYCNHCTPDKMKEDFKKERTAKVVSCIECGEPIKNREIYYTIFEVRNFEIQGSRNYCEKHLPEI